MITYDLLKITDQWKDAELTVLLFLFIYYIFVSLSLQKKGSIHTRKATYQFSEKKASKELFYTLLTYSYKTHPILLRPFVENQKLAKIVL